METKKVHGRPPIPAFLPGASHGQRGMVGYSPWGHRVGHDRAHTNITALLMEGACGPGRLLALLSQGREDKAQGKNYT